MKDTGRPGERLRLGSNPQTEDDSVREDAPGAEDTPPTNDNTSGNAVGQNDVIGQASAKLPEATEMKTAAHKSSTSTQTKQEESAARSAASMKTDKTEPTHTEPKPTIAADLPLATGLQSRIGAQLQSLYNDLLTEETPDRFLKLLEDLDRKSPPR